MKSALSKTSINPESKSEPRRSDGCWPRVTCINDMSPNIQQHFTKVGSEIPQKK